MKCFANGYLFCFRGSFRRFSRVTSPLSSKNDCSDPCEPQNPENYEVCTISDNMVDPCKPEPAVVIIGAGIAGLSAAQRLVQSGISNFTILEATDRYEYFRQT